MELTVVNIAIEFFFTLSLPKRYFRTLIMSVDVQLLRIRDDSGKLPIHVACQTSTPLDCLAALVDRDAATLQMTDHAGALPLHEYCLFTL